MILAEQSTRLKKFVIGAIVAMSVVMIFMYASVDESPTMIQLMPNMTLAVPRIIYKDEFLVNTKGCVIPMLKPFPPNLRRLIHIRKHTTCNQGIPITYEDNYKIKINTTFVKNQANFSHCSYIPFKKTVGRDGGVTRLWNLRKNFTKEIEGKHEFVTVQCFNKTHFKLSTQHYAFIIRNKTLDKILDSRYNKSATHKPLNILMFTFESTSRLNFVRHMNLTRQYIMDKMHAIEMVGYNKIGRNTFPNMIGVLAGVPEGKLNKTSKGYLDSHPYIWKDLSKSGYRTSFIEDDYKIATFQYLKKGFQRPPVDHYLFTYITELEKTSNKKLCWGNKLIMEVMFDKIVDFVRVYRDVPHFSWSMISRFTHDNPNGLGLQDIPYLKMIKKMHSRKHLENTVLIFIADHGSRYGSIRNTHQGRLEENLPALYFVFPEWFRKTHKDLYENLKANSHKLTNNFDVYATLRDIINIGKGKVDYDYKGKYGISTLRPIPENRTCEEIHIPSYFCACGRYEKVNTTDSLVRNVSKFVVSEINRILSNTSLCANLTLSKVLSSEMLFQSEKLIKKGNLVIRDYLVRIQVLPSNGLFEAEVRFNKSLKKMKRLGNISRLDKYKSQSLCMGSVPNGKFLEQYCFCKQ